MVGGGVSCLFQDGSSTALEWSARQEGGRALVTACFLEDHSTARPGWDGRCRLDVDVLCVPREGRDM